MSKHTDTGRAGTRRGGKKLWILIPVIAVLVIAYQSDSAWCGSRKRVGVHGRDYSRAVHR